MVTILPVGPSEYPVCWSLSCLHPLGHISHVWQIPDDITLIRISPASWRCRQIKLNVCSHLLPVCRTLSAAWRSGVSLHSVHSAKQKLWWASSNKKLRGIRSVSLYLCIINPLHGLVELSAVVGDGCGILLEHSQQRSCLQTKSRERRKQEGSQHPIMILGGSPLMIFNEP